MCQEARDNSQILICVKTSPNRKYLKFEDILNGSLNFKIKAFTYFKNR